MVAITAVLGTIDAFSSTFGGIFGGNDEKFCRNTAEALRSYVQNVTQVLPGATRIFNTSGTGSWSEVRSTCPGIPDRLTIHLAKLSEGHPFSSLDQRDPILPKVREEAIRRGLITGPTVGFFGGNGDQVRVAGLALPTGGIPPGLFLIGGVVLLFLLLGRPRNA